MTVQVKCKASAEPCSLELCRAAAFTRTRNFLFASTKVLHLQRALAGYGGIAMKKVRNHVEFL